MKFSATLLLVTATAFQALLPLSQATQDYSDYDKSYHKAEYKDNDYGYTAKEYNDYGYKEKNTTYETRIRRRGKYQDYGYEDKDDTTTTKPKNTTPRTRKLQSESKDDDAEKYYKRDGYVAEILGDDKDNDYGYNAKEEYNDYDHNNKYADKYDSNDEKYYKRDYGYKSTEEYNDYEAKEYYSKDGELCPADKYENTTPPTTLTILPRILMERQVQRLRDTTPKTNTTSTRARATTTTTSMQRQTEITTRRTTTENGVHETYRYYYFN
ncbi:hypothetical protein BCR33DRAFT_741420 [Rhizoclosmatium globosum]|uniref:Uncharacterized protein n=1 Tax=Rhizoclosmatium globosum TaxID=329046 RepID=A0A1Y2BUX4_9FUNG|nr:hypothetical protein BCR33DRAFT_741420 [Rhizoclosmatium globosum]|eukprot:ORY38543.1 hypothetical protein BCR33DRAFT_741420 [Rhizoclosmatium globosum]